jgi:hypothetical protein
MVRKKKGPGRGGAREGAGRKREIDEPVKLSIVFEQEQVDWLDSQAEARGLPTKAHVVRALVDAERERER